MADPAFIFLAVPCYAGQLDLAFITSALRLEAACAERGVGFHLELLEDDRQIARARARLARMFLARPEATHLLFCDADIGFAEEAAFRLVAADRGIVAGVCPLKAIDWERVRGAALAGSADLQSAALTYVVRFLPSPDSAIEIGDDGFAQVAYAGTGFQLIRRDALEAVVAAHPELLATLDDGPTAMMFEPMIEPETGEYLSEDYAFCRRYRDLGGEVWADARTRFTHAGRYPFTGGLIDALKPSPKGR